MDELRQVIAQNIATLRKAAGMTQAELAERLNYSDKAVSKWERAEAMPDVETLTRIAGIFGVTVNELLSQEKKPPKRALPMKKYIVALLSSGIVWLVAVAIYVILNMIWPLLPNVWLVFIVALPVTAIVNLVLTVKWGARFLTFICESVLVWTIALLIYLVLPAYEGAWFIFLLPIPLEGLALLWYLFKKVK